MGYNNDTLPLERQTFFGGRLMPLHGVQEWEWWPTAEEEELIASVIASKETEARLRKKFSEHLTEVNAYFTQYSYYFWIVKNFTLPEYTDDYTKPVTIAMIERAREAFELEKIEPWVEKLKSNDLK